MLIASYHNRILDKINRFFILFFTLLLKNKLILLW